MNLSNVIFKKLVDKGIDACFMGTGGGAMLAIIFLSYTAHKKFTYKIRFS